jgi:hypothetical protein
MGNQKIIILKINEEEDEIKTTLSIMNEDIFVFHDKNNIISFHKYHIRYKFPQIFT